MSATELGTDATVLNDAATSERNADHAAINAEQSAPTKTKRESAATKRANANAAALADAMSALDADQLAALATKLGLKLVDASAKVTTKNNGPSRAAKKSLGTMIIANMFDYVSACDLPDGITREDALTFAAGRAAYIPGVWDPRFGDAPSAGGRRNGTATEDAPSEDAPSTEDAPTS